jgi:hypothetical protein
MRDRISPPDSLASDLTVVGSGTGFALRNDLLELGVFASGVTFLGSIVLAAVLLRRSLSSAPGALVGIGSGSKRGSDDLAE